MLTIPHAGRTALCLALVGALVGALAACGPDAPEAPPADAGEVLTSADAVADRMLARYDGTLGTVETMTVYADGATASYARNLDSLVLNPFVLQVQPASEEKADAISAQLLYSHIPNVRRLAQGLRVADLAGPLDYNGNRVYVFTTDDPTPIVGEAGAPEDRRGTIDFRVYVDARTFDVREIYQGVSDSSFARPYVNRIVYDDVRTVEGVPIPFRVRQLETGADAMMDESTKTIARGQLELQRRIAEAQDAGPKRDALLEENDRQMRLINEGLADVVLAVDSVRVVRGG